MCGIAESYRPIKHCGITYYCGSFPTDAQAPERQHMDPEGGSYPMVGSARLRCIRRLGERIIFGCVTDSVGRPRKNAVG